MITRQELNSDSGRIAVLNDGSGTKIIASNQCGDFPFKLVKSTDPRVDIDSIADYDKNVVAYVGARNWNKFKFKKDYTNASQLKFSNIKTPGAGYLVDMKWWLDYTVQITFNKFPYPNTSNTSPITAKNLFMEDNIMCLRAYPAHQSTDNIHLRLNNRDMICYPTQMLNQRLEYWNQDRLKESCGFCPHRKPSCQSTYQLESTANAGRSQFMNLGSTYDGDFGNEVVLGNVTYDLKVEESPKYPASSDNKAKYMPWSYISGTITFNMREPVMAEPLDYYSSKSGSKTMNNITAIDLEYNFNNLRNMILFNQATLLKMSKGITALEDITINSKKVSKGEEDWWNSLLSEFLESYMNVEITDATLEIDIATPQVPPSMPFVTDYVEYRRYETKASSGVTVTDIWGDNNTKTYEITSDIYSLSYMPNSIYVWVAPNDAKIYGSNFRCFYNNSYAQITNIEIDYGNLSKLGNNYEERDLFLMALRNGLEDRQYVDWTRTKKSFYKRRSEEPALTQDSSKIAKNINDNYFYGVGSVLRIIPGVDLCSGGEQTLIGGMKITNETIKFKVTYKPLNCFVNNIVYSLYVAFEYNGICTITPGFCDLAMIHIDSFNQIANAERAPGYKISRIYGKGLWDKTKRFLNKANNFAKRSKIVTKTLRTIGNPLTNKLANITNSLGYGYGAGVTRMRGGMVIPPGSFYRTY